MTPHIHQKEIIAWANGAIIQYWNDPDGWLDCYRNAPGWRIDTKYRVKPDIINELCDLFCRGFNDELSNEQVAALMLRKFNITFKDES